LRGKRLDGKRVRADGEERRVHEDQYTRQPDRPGPRRDVR
jgi:hypothetical protein